MIGSKNLSQVAPNELKTFFESFDDVLCDCDGVLFLLYVPIPGASDGLEVLRKLGKKVRFVSNNCTQTVESFCNTLTKFGLNSQTDDVIIPTIAIISYLKSINFNKKLYVISCNALRQELTSAGFEVADIGSVYTEEKRESLIAELEADPDVGAVIVDFDMNVNYVKLQKALMYINKPDMIFITGGLDMRIPMTKDIGLMGSGYFQKALMDMSGRVPLQFGKPGEYMHYYVRDRYKLDPKRTLFIGDTFSDFEFAADNGYQMMGVLSGVIKEEDLENCEDKRLLPKYYINSLDDFRKLVYSLE